MLSQELDCEVLALKEELHQKELLLEAGNKSKQLVNQLLHDR